MGHLDWIKVTLDALRQESAVVLVTQCAVEGSAPREAGAKMLVTKSSFWGAIGGGNLEYLVLEQSRELLARPDLTHLLQDYPLGPLLSQCCGGHVRVLLERLTDADKGWLEALDQQTGAAGNMVLETRLRGAGHRKRLRRAQDVRFAESSPFAGEEGVPFPDCRPPRDQCAFYREFIAAPLPSVHVFGAGHVGRALMHVLAISEFPLRWYDPRREYEGGDGPVPVELLAAPEEAVAALPAQSICLVFTHAHELDYQLVRAILLRGDFQYCGLIGSKTKRARFVRRFASDGVPEVAIARLACPIGLLKIKGKTPFAIALSVAAELNNLVVQAEAAASVTVAEAPE